MIVQLEARVGTQPSLPENVFYLAFSLAFYFTAWPVIGILLLVSQLQSLTNL